MSQAVKAAMLATKDLGKNERAVAIAIAAHANREGHAWPSVATLANFAGCSERTVQRALARLVQAGRLAVTTASGIATRVYRLLTARASTSPEGVTERAPGVTDQDAGVTDSALGGDSQAVTRSSEDHREDGKRAGAREWRQWVKPKTPRERTAYERRGAALPVADRADQCPRHRGSPAQNCGPCRSERIAEETS